MRPRYHFAPAANWLSDPNGLIHHAGEWHLFYQYNPHGEDWGHMSWGHAVSRELATWDELPVALDEDARHMIFSGSAVVDRTGAAGFGADALVALYTGAERGPGARQVQCLAWSTDRGRHWTKYAGNPVIDRGNADFRDPNVFWHAASGQWIMAVVLAEEPRALIYGSRDLTNWTELSSIAADGAPGQVWECPLLIELPVAGGGTRWLFKVDVLRGAPGSGAIYRTGRFDGQRFVAEGAWQVADWGADFYAAVAWHEPRDAAGRPLWIGWMGNHAYQGQLPRQGWRGAMSLPRRLSLRRSGGALQLCQEIEPAAAAQVPAAEAGAPDEPIALYQRLAGDRFALQFGDGEGRTLTVERTPGTLRVIRRDPASPVLDAVREAPLPAGAPLDLWLDAGSIELLGDAGSLAMTLQHRLAGSRVTRHMAMTAGALSHA